MSTAKLNVVSRTSARMGLCIIAGVLIASCSATGPGDRQINPKFDGTWLGECYENRIFMVPEEDQPEGYVRSTLVIDSSTNSYSTTRRVYVDSQCLVENPDANNNTVSGDIAFDGVTTTRSGLEATVVRYFNDGTVPDLIGLLYRDGNVLYRDLRQSTLIEDIVPDQLSFSTPWQLVL